MRRHLPLLLLIPAGCSGTPETAHETEEPAPVPPPTLVLLTLDTTRADALGSYGGPDGDTPTLDALAASGVRFGRAFSHAPSTQSAHASLFTGLDPHSHGVPFNGVPLGPDHPTLAEVLSDQGWATQAVVAAAVLGRSLGLDRGFDGYDDRFTSEGPEDRAPEVTARALAAVDRAPADRPLFLWAHYFDPHHPYAPLSGGTGETADVMRGDLDLQGLDSADLARLRGLYQAEVRQMDTGIGALLAGLEARGRLQHALIVAVADHGEGFGELPGRPFLHGEDVDPFATWVPLIVTGRGRLALAPRLVQQPVALSEVAQLALDQLGVAGRLGPGRRVAPLVSGGRTTAAPIFLEATKPRREESGGRWNNLGNEHGVVWQRLLLMERVEHEQPPSLWQLQVPPVRLPDDHPRLPVLLEMLRAWDAAAPPQAGATDQGVRAALEALGYLETEVP